MDIYISDVVKFSRRNELLSVLIRDLFRFSKTVTYVQPYPNGFCINYEKEFCEAMLKIEYGTLINITTNKIDLDKVSECVIVYGSSKRFREILKKEGLNKVFYVPHCEEDLIKVKDICKKKKKEIKTIYCHYM